MSGASNEILKQGLLLLPQPGTSHHHLVFRVGGTYEIARELAFIISTATVQGLSSASDIFKRT